jgi:type IV secretory pathway VirB2 component (pilin)
MNLLSLINGHKTYAAVLLTIASGLGLIFTKNDTFGTTEFFQALTLVFGSASVVGLRHAVSKVPTDVLEAAAKQK